MTNERAARLRGDLCLDGLPYITRDELLELLKDRERLEKAERALKNGYEVWGGKVVTIIDVEPEEAVTFHGNTFREALDKLPEVG